jgi:glycosyltransferase involved in cell wall biosynthesis
LVSCIIPKRKDEDISKLIKSIKNSLYPHIEIIVVDEGLERSAQRNIGIERAKGEFLLFVDSDWILKPWLIAVCVSMMYKFDAIYIPEVIKTKGLFAYIRNWERQFYTATPIDCVRFVRREGCPRFDETMSGPEDADWDRRVLGRRGVCLVSYYHYDNVSMIKWFCKKAYYSKSMAKYAQKNKNDKVLDWKWRCWGIFTEQGKWREFIKRPDLALAVLTMIFIRGIIYRANTLSS